MRMGKLPPAGVKQGLEKKEGLFRKHMMVCLLSPHI
jgi:DNA-directed RNA polymerase I subunit RPA1